MTPFDIRGQVAFVTGAAAGLGWAMTQALADAGARLALFDRDPAVTARARMLQAKGVSALAFLGDVTDAAAQDAAVGQVLADWGRLDIAIANAGISDAMPGPVDAMGLEDWSRVIAVNLDGVLHTIRAALPPMRAAGRGKIVTVASMWGLAAPAGVFPRPAYAASKGAVVNLTREVALQVARANIQVNALCPGIFQTETRPRDPAAAVAYTPMGRLGRPEEIAGAVLFLSSAASDFMTGQTLVIDGGVLAR